MNVNNNNEWNEVYNVYDKNNNKNRKLCNYIAMIKLCVSIQTIETENDNNNNIRLSIQYITDKIVKNEIKPQQNKLSEWIEWLDLL